VTEKKPSYAALKAFSATKPTQFDSFMRKWKEPEKPKAKKPQKVKKAAKRTPSPTSVPESKEAGTRQI